jgi:hypothetical protein
MRETERLIFTLDICRLSFRLNVKVNLPAYLSTTTIKAGARMVGSNLIRLRQPERERQRQDKHY